MLICQIVETMNLTKIFLFLLFAVSNYACSQKSDDNKRKFKNTIELSIKSSSEKLNPLISNIVNHLKEQKSDTTLFKQYDEAKLNIIVNKKLVNDLTEVDKDFNLKEKTLLYFDNCNKLLDGFMFPAINYINGSEKIENIDFNNMFAQIQTAINDTSVLSEFLEKFCVKYKLDPKVNLFDKNQYNAQIDEINKRWIQDLNATKVN